MKNRLLKRLEFGLRRRWARLKARDPQLRAQLKSYNDFFFNELGVSREQAVTRLREIMERAGIEPTEQRDSIHLLAFAAVEVSGFCPANVLELGTGYGYSTSFLAELFPQARVYTVELPPEDPGYDRRIHPIGQAKYEQILEERLARPNIVPICANTVWLLKQTLPDFDLIWLDASHRYPAVAWDHFYCMNKLAPGGWLFTDDMRPPENPHARWNPYCLDIYELINYFNTRQEDKFRLLLKRENPIDFLVDPKYVGFLQKSSSGN